MINKKKLGVLLATTMMLGMGTNVSAIDTVPTVDNNGSVSITKNFEMADGIQTPNVTFKFTATSTTPDAPTATIKDIVYANADQGTPVNGKVTVSKKSNMTFGDFKHAGEYVYTVTETKENTEGVTYSTETYILRVYVINSDSGLKIKNMTAEKGTSNGTQGNKVSEISFTNTYQKDASLTIEKQTTGDLADKTKKFGFTLTIYPSATETNQNVTYTGKIGNSNVQFNANTATDFELANGESLVFEKLPAGTTYEVVEKGVEDGYTPTISVIENGTKTVAEKQGTDADALSSKQNAKDNLVGENENKVTFVNRYQDVPMTGVIMTNLPWIMVMGVAIVTLGALVFLKNRKNSHL